MVLKSYFLKTFICEFFSRKQDAKLFIEFLTCPDLMKYASRLRKHGKKTYFFAAKLAPSTFFDLQMWKTKNKENLYHCERKHFNSIAMLLYILFLNFHSLYRKRLFFLFLFRAICEAVSFGVQLKQNLEIGMTFAALFLYKLRPKLKIGKTVYYLLIHEKINNSFYSMNQSKN